MNKLELNWKGKLELPTFFLYYAQYIANKLFFMFFIYDKMYMLVLILVF